jgi:3-phenylpropionate/trans-cinnamate dioxygenase ferredoxin reductase subunit
VAFLPNEPSYDVVIVGAGHGGSQAAAALRQRGYKGSILVIGEDPELPYERPALSKDYLAGDKSFERLLLKPAAFWAERDIALRLGRRVVSVDPGAKRIVCDDRSAVTYGVIIWAAGGKARQLSCDGSDLAGVHTLRDRADIDRLKAELATAETVAIVGGGFIGLEAAAVLAKAGKAVTILEAADRLLARVACEAVSRFYEAEHEAHGVDVRCGVQVVSIDGRDGKATAVCLASGDRVAADLVIVGIGIVPAVEPLVAAGCGQGPGVEVDAFCRSQLEDIFAIGDCASHLNPFAPGEPLRLESVQNANDQAATVAKVLTGTPEPYVSVPWFWSNQYDLRLQTIGVSRGYDEVVLRGDPASRSFSAVYLRQGRVVALDCVNAVKDYVQGKRLVVKGVVPDRAQLANPALPLKDLQDGGEPALPSLALHQEDRR